MAVSLGNENFRRIRTWFNARAFALVSMSILLCASIDGCAGPSTPPGAFVLSSPANNAVDVPLTPTLTWTDATGETNYNVQIDNQNTFSSPLVYENTGIAANTTSFVVPDGVLASGTTYYWRIVAINIAGSEIASNAPFSFTTLSSGALVAEFGTGGVVTSNPSTGLDGPRDIAIDLTAMYVVGVDESPGNLQWRIEKRSLTDGSLAAGFGTDGVITSNLSTGDDYAMDIAIDSTAMYVVGFDYGPSPGTGNSQWRIEKRRLTDGSLVAEFGTGGVVTSNPSTRGDYAVGIAIDSTAMYVVGLDESLGPLNCQWRIEKRGLTDGSLVAGFGTGGVVTSNPGADCEVQLGIAIDSTAMYVVGVDNSPGNLQWRIEKRSLTDGSLAAGFGTGGVVTSNPSTGFDGAMGIAVDSTVMYVVGFDESASPGNPQWRIEKRSLTDGSLVAGFGTGGVVTSNSSTGSGGAWDIAIDSTEMYVVGFDNSPGNLQWRIEKRVR